MVLSKTSLNINDLTMTAVFKTADAASFLWKNMDDAHIIYDLRSGHSQVLNDFAFEIFALINEKPRKLSEILAELELILEHPVEDELKHQVAQTVAEFDKMGLIEPTKTEPLE